MKFYIPEELNSKQDCVKKLGVKMSWRGLLFTKLLVNNRYVFTFYAKTKWKRKKAT